MKEDIKTNTLRFCKGRTRDREIAISQLSEKITDMENQLHHKEHLPNFIQQLEDSRADLESLLDQKIREVMFRTKTKWYEDGEKNSKYFYALEQTKYEAKTCSTMFKEDGTLTVDSTEILEIQRKFYEELYTSDSSVKFDIQNQAEDELSNEIREELQKQFSEKEIAQAVSDLNNNKVPGPDGLPVDFYKVFYAKIRVPLYEQITSAFNNRKLHRTAMTGIINVIPKPGKDTRLVRNLRPITLLNTDYKIIEKAIANRMVPWLSELIHEDQRGFIPGRRIAVNIRKIFEIIHSNRNSPVVVLQADFAKAFDRVETCAIYGAMQYFGFPQYLIDWLEILYTGFRVKILNNGNISSDFAIERSVHQGGCCSAAIFVCVAETLARELRKDGNIKGAFISDIENLLNLYTDDTDMSINTADDSSIQRIFQHIENFGQHTGLVLNYDKTTVYRIGSLKDSAAKFYTERKLNWTNEPINVLGVTVDTDIHKAMDLNYERVCIKAEKKLARWQKRNLSLLGKVNIINTLIASIFVHSMTVLPSIPDKYVNRMEKVMVHFLWNGHKPKIPLDILKLKKKDGGLQLVDLRVKDAALKAVWIKILQQDVQINAIVNSTFSPVLGNVLWRCNLKAEDVQHYTGKNIQADPFWLDVLTHWCNFNFKEDLRKQDVIWMNSNIRIEGRPVLWTKQIRHGLLRISQLMDGSDWIKSNAAHEQFDLTTLQFNALKTAIGRGILKTDDDQDDIPLDNFDTIGTDSHPTASIYNVLCKSKKGMRLIAERAAKNMEECSSDGSLCEYLKCCGEIFRISNVPKYRSFQYRLMMRGLVTNCHLYRWGIRSSNLCTFCELEKETVYHLFGKCNVVRGLYEDLKQWICVKGYGEEEEMQTLLTKDIMFASYKGENASLINFLFVVCKQYIYRQRCTKRVVKFNELRNIIINIEKVEKYIAIKNARLRKHAIKWCLPEIIDFITEQQEHSVNMAVESITEV